MFSSVDKRELLIWRTFLLSETFVVLPNVLVTVFRNTLFSINKSVLICTGIDESSAIHHSTDSEVSQPAVRISKIPQLQIEIKVKALYYLK